MVLPILDTDACAVATRIQFVVVVAGGDGVLLAAEHFNLVTWVTTVFAPGVRVGGPRREESGGGWTVPGGDSVCLPGSRGRHDERRAAG